MNSAAIRDLGLATLSGALPFPEIVAGLVSAGVEYYHVDYVGLRFSFYGDDGSMVTLPISYEGTPAVATNFDAPALCAAIFDSQRNGQKFREFSQRAMESGVQGYYAFLRGKRVTYLGRQGDQHVEWFPGAKPGGAKE